MYSVNGVWRIMFVIVVMMSSSEMQWMERKSCNFERVVVRMKRPVVARLGDSKVLLT